KAQLGARRFTGHLNLANIVVCSKRHAAAPDDAHFLRAIIDLARRCWYCHFLQVNRPHLQKSSANMTSRHSLN
ncbi:MAG TPA: hypothetical protein VK813_07660, partial [Edaphobacter sp.]|nr:hypothetical protein [Edaphobacter sp.]